ncbi:17012_t:CDS:2 [Acaulospora colombiana]|uniref:17012_t:CDS:1 n=1 Tax=Acaulospora colombiana TaxID=27376 RepID=A0ACA9L0R0_9GLOM|nr:17012_t:CDS:2 [Acaulospora colombiana]
MNKAQPMPMAAFAWIGFSIASMSTVNVNMEVAMISSNRPCKIDITFSSMFTKTVAPPIGGGCDMLIKYAPNNAPKNSATM